MNPEILAKAGTEHSHQVALFMWCALNVGKFPDLKWFHAIKNEEKSGSVVVGARSKAAGIKSGVSDTLLPVRRGEYSGLYIELKRPSRKPKCNGKGGVSDEQLEFGKFVQSQGFGFVVCYGWEEAVKVLIQYLEQK
jgi:hypothetical protein